MDGEQRKQRVYEQLGAPSLLYRNAQAYELDEQENTSQDVVEAYQDTRERLHRSQAKWYYHIDTQQSEPLSEQVSAGDASSLPEETLERREFSRMNEERANLRKVELERQGIDRPDQILNSSQQHDTAFVPAGRISKKSFKNRGIKDDVRQFSELHDRERRDHGDPDYMAPFDINCVQNVLSSAEKSKNKKAPDLKRRQRQTFDRDHPNGPTRYGNCILCFPCACSVCCASPNHSTCLLHPVGALMDQVRLSFLSLPRPVVETFGGDTDDSMEDLDVGDTVRQLQECGTLTFVARTDLHCTVFSVEMVEPNNDGPTDQCWGRVKLCKLHRIDLRSLSSSFPSYRPIDVACHPNFGRSFTRPNIAILSGLDGADRARNCIHRVQCGRSAHSTKHVVANLQDISEIDFSNLHPMVLWAAGRSNVRPTLVTNVLFQRPRVGYGSSLFTVDLRTDQAIFQWSPSKEEFLIEGTHSISGILTDWKMPHSLWISSTSAGKTWEIDSRMPCRSITSWAMPHACDEPGVVMPSSGLYGAGTLFAQPVTGHSLDSSPSPMLSVGKTPGTFGFQLYQRPIVGPRFQSNSIECAASPGLAALENASIATSSIFPLPDVSDNVFTCGLCAFRAPVGGFLSVTELIQMGFIQEDISDVVCAVTMTNNGDLYVHSLMESKATHQASRTHPGLPVGCSMIAAPKVSSTQVSRGMATLQLTLSNEYPVPSNAYTMSSSDSDSGVLRLPSQEREDAGSESHELANIKPDETIPTVGEERDEHVRIQATLHARAEDQIRSSHSLFQTGTPSVVEGGGMNLDSLRSDVTAEVIQKASQTWETDDSDSDDGIDEV